MHVNANGWACYDKIDVNLLETRIKSFLPDAVFHKTSVEQFPFLTGLSAHYMKLTEEQYNEGIKILNNEC